jgi:hypothetical protein
LGDEATNTLCYCVGFASNDWRRGYVLVISKRSVMDLKKLLILFKSMLLRQLVGELKTQGLAFASLTDAIPLFDNQDGGSRL